MGKIWVKIFGGVFGKGGLQETELGGPGGEGVCSVVLLALVATTVIL